MKQRGYFRMRQNAEKYEHESQGIIKLSKVSSSKPVHLFGSRVPHNTNVRLTIQNGVLYRGLNRDTYSSSGKSIVEVEMSELQFAELITSIGYGDGVPVTLRKINGTQLQEPVYESEMETFSNEFKREMHELTKVVKTLTTDTKERLKDSKPLNKSEREDIISALEGVERLIGANLPFMERSFNENMMRTMQEVKMSIKSLVQTDTSQQIETTTTNPTSYLSDDIV